MTPQPAARRSRPVVKLVLLPLRGYQKLISPLLGARCRYYPTCSEYAAQAMLDFGILRGAILAGWRLLRCNPWSLGGFDPVNAQTLFKPAATIRSSSTSDS